MKFLYHRRSLVLVPSLALQRRMVGKRPGWDCPLDRSTLAKAGSSWGHHIWKTRTGFLFITVTLLHHPPKAVIVQIIDSHHWKKIQEEESQPWGHEGHELLSRWPVFQPVNHRLSILGLGPLCKTIYIKCNRSVIHDKAERPHYELTEQRLPDGLTSDILKSIPELLYSRVGHHLVFAVEKVSLVVCKLLVKGICFPQTGIQTLMDPWHQHRLDKPKTTRVPLLLLVTPIWFL